MRLVRFSRTQTLSIVDTPYTDCNSQIIKKKVQDIFANDDGCNGDTSKIKPDQKNLDFKYCTNNDNDESYSADLITNTFGTRDEHKSRNSSTMKKIINDTAEDEKDNEDVMNRKDKKL